jgi:hypothetical protein
MLHFGSKKKEEKEKKRIGLVVVGWTVIFAFGK